MLSLIGLGLWDEKDVSIRGLEELKKSDRVYAEVYTNDINSGTLDRLAEMIDKPIIVLSREQVEDAKELLEEAKKKNVSLIIPGDPMISTTHISLRIDAKKKGVDLKIIHASSILSAAISESGLHTYKFGKPVTLPFWTEKYKPTSTYDSLAENAKNGLHTLLFIDLKEGKGMNSKEAFELMGKIEEERKAGLLSKKSKILALSRVGSDEQKVSYGTIEKLEKMNVGKPPLIFIVPGKLHFTEEEVLSLHEI